MVQHMMNYAVKMTAVTTLLLGVAHLGGCVSSEPETMSYSSPLSSPTDFETEKQRPPSAETLYRMGRILSAQGKDIRAMATLRSAVQRYPDYVPAYSEIAAIQMRHDRHDAAEETIMLAIEVAPLDAMLHNNLGMVRMLREDYEGARSAFGRAHELSPDNAKYLGNLALATGMSGRYEESLGLYEQMLPPAQAHYNLAVVCEARGDMERAQLEYAIAANNGMPLPEEAPVEGTEGSQPE